MSQNDIEQIELTIQEAEKLVERAAQARRLAKNRDFRLLVIDGYFLNEAARLAHLVSDPGAAPHREAIMRDLDGVGAFKRYLHTCTQFGDMAAVEIKDAREAMEEIRAEEAGE